MTEREQRAEYHTQSHPLRVRDVPSRQRPRELFDRMGAAHVEDDVLIALILRSGVQGVNVIQLAQHLLARYGSLTAMAQASVKELAKIKGMGPVKAQVLKASLELARRLTMESVPEDHKIAAPQDVSLILREVARTLEEEVFWVLLLDSRNKLKQPPVEISRGIVDASLVHPREVFKEAVRAACSAVVLAHNHPSGDPTPSAEDIRITRQLVEAGKLIDIDVLDHVILGRPGLDGRPDFLSLREAGLVRFS